jgi:hypothetical protein
MTAYSLQGHKIENVPVGVPASAWKTVVTLDWRNPSKLSVYRPGDSETSAFKIDTTLTSSQLLSRAKTLATAKVIEVDGYLNVSANLSSGVFATDWATRWVRINTTNDMGLQNQPLAVPPSKAGTVAPTHFAYPHWKGANPGGVHLQVRHLSGFYDEFTVDTRYIKVGWWT